MSTIQNMNLSQLETAALRLAISREDSDIRAALEAFKKDRDESALVKKLRETAKKMITSTLDEAGYQLAEDDDDEEEAEEVEEVLDDEDEDDDDNDEDEDDNDDDSKDEDNDNGDNERSSGLMSSKVVWAHIFPILVSELRKGDIISSSEESILLREFLNDNDVLNAALDVYDTDSNMAELVDTLKKLSSSTSSSATSASLTASATRYSPNKSPLQSQSQSPSKTQSPSGVTKTPSPLTSTASASASPSLSLLPAAPSPSRVSASPRAVYPPIPPIASPVRSPIATTVSGMRTSPSTAATATGSPRHGSTPLFARSPLASVDELSHQ